MLEAINELIGSIMASPWANVAIFLVSVIDAFFPPVPSETAVIAAVAADQSLLRVVALAAGGAFLGDHISYALGRFLGAPAVRRLLRGERGRAAQVWAERMLRARGGVIIVAFRFIPGGRTATTLTAGTVRYPLTRFAAFDALAVSCWAVYAGLIGYFAGGLFEDNHLLAVAVGIGISIGISAAVESARFLMRRRRVRVTRREGGLASHTAAQREPRPGGRVALLSRSYTAQRPSGEQRTATASCRPTTPECRERQDYGHENDSTGRGR